MADVDMTDAPTAPAKTKAAKAGGDGAAEGKKKFEVKKVCIWSLDGDMADTKLLQWNAVALWAWDIVVDNCAICRNHIMDLCKAHLLDLMDEHLPLLQASSVRPTRLRQRPRSAPWHGVSAM